MEKVWYQNVGGYYIRNSYTKNDIPQYIRTKFIFQTTTYMNKSFEHIS
jgi:hypothetical protein